MPKFHPIPNTRARALQHGGPDANNQPAEHSISNGQGNPCRHCLNYIPKDAKMLICAYRPFPSSQPYAEIGPIFLCADDCTPFSGDTPEILQGDASVLIKGYTSDNRIAYGTGKIVTKPDIADEVNVILRQKGIEYVHVRSATNNCYLTKITLD